ncbi:unnamed protein product [Clavelina lepadiformis]|uniref:Uncharacterized protein n=1 Tax=Clavelina lepadiformis TaxID=159417 RepID=A0ABP0FUM0_CLALP
MRFLTSHSNLSTFNPPLHHLSVLSARSTVTLISGWSITTDAVLNLDLANLLKRRSMASGTELPRYPATDQRGNFWLLPFGPGPVRSSLDNLDISRSRKTTILTLSLARTPDRHRSRCRRTPSLKPSTNPSLQSSWITGMRHNARREKAC